MKQDISDISSQFLRDRHAILAFIYGLTRDANLSEDILQEVWLKLYDAIHGKKTRIHNQLAWCRGTAKNIILHHWRNKKTAKVVMDSELVDLVEKAFEEYAEEDDLAVRRQAALRNCYNGLKEDARVLLRLRYEQGLSFQQMSGQLERSAAGLMMALSRLRKGLLECIEGRLRLRGDGA